MRNKFIVLFLGIFSSVAVLKANDITIIPYPERVVKQDGIFKLPDRFTLNSPKEFSDIASLLLDDIKSQTGLRGRRINGNADINMVPDSTLSQEAYCITVSSDGILLRAADFQGMSFAVTSILQMMEANGSLNKVEINDSPVREYRGLMLDVARQRIEFETLKQCVDLARWYKIKAIQLHLSDDQSFTFESKTFPNLATPGRYYTQKQLKELAEYARVRGVTIFPELDLPGHSAEMRNRMPEIFGDPCLGIIDIVNEKTVNAVMTIAKEMMDVFQNAPFFHIGADECWFGDYEKQEYVQSAIKDRGFDNVRDLYLEFIVKMYDFVKANGLKPLAWESFPGKGSHHVRIPEDLIVFAWETLYQTPQSLLENGYTIINASWKPMYVVPGLRWSPEYIYNFSMTRWENHWNVTPSYQHPICLDSVTSPVMGGQMCSWEMDDPSQILTLHTRLAAASEAMWNDGRQRPFEEFLTAFDSVDKKIMTHFFPVLENRDGFKSPCKRQLDDNRINIFANKGVVKMKPINPSYIIRYTTDGSMPNSSSTILDSVLELTSNTFIKYGVFNRKGKIKGYHSVKYLFDPIDAINIGNVYDPRDINILNPEKLFCGDVKIILNNGCPGTVIHYTIDGSQPDINSPEYVNPIVISSTVDLTAQCFDVYGNPQGNRFKCKYINKEM